MKRRHFLAMAAAAAAAHVQPVRASSYPDRPIRLIVPFAPGGSTDVVARLVSEPLYKELGQPVVVENRPGAGGSTGTLEMLRSAPDGYTILMATLSVTAANPAFNPRSGYDPVADFAHIINIAASPSIIAVHPGFPARNYQDFIAELKKKPGGYTYGTPGVGGIVHLLMEYFIGLTGTSIRHIPYKGAGPSLNAVIAGEVDMVFDTPPSLMPFVKAGKLVPIVSSWPERWKDLPDVPTFKEVGEPRMTRMQSFGLVGPKGLPAEVVTRLNAATRKVVADPAVRKRIDDSGAVVVASTPEEYAADTRSTFNELKAVVKERKLSVE